MSTIKTNTLANLAGDKSVPVATVTDGTARAVVNYDTSSGAPAVRKSFNVSSLTDTGTGKTVVNFSTAMVNTVYTVVASTNGYPGADNFYYGAGCYVGNSPGTMYGGAGRTAASCNVLTTGNNGAADARDVDVVVFP